MVEGQHTTGSQTKSVTIQRLIALFYLHLVVLEGTCSQALYTRIHYFAKSLSCEGLIPSLRVEERKEMEFWIVFRLEESRKESPVST